MEGTALSHEKIADAAERQTVAAEALHNPPLLVGSLSTDWQWGVKPKDARRSPKPAFFLTARTAIARLVVGALKAHRTCGCPPTEPAGVSFSRGRAAATATTNNNHNHRSAPLSCFVAARRRSARLPASLSCWMKSSRSSSRTNEGLRGSDVKKVFWTASKSSHQQRRDVPRLSRVWRKERRVGCTKRGPFLSKPHFRAGRAER